MLSFYFTSLSFKPPLKAPHKFYIRVELPDGSAKTTETTTYNCESNIAVFSEAFDFLVSDLANTSYFHLEITEYGQNASINSTTVGKTTLYISSKFFNEDNKITLATTYQSDVTLYFVIDASNQLKEKLMKSRADQSFFKSPRDSSKEDGLVYSTGQLDFLKLGPLFYEFVLALSPLVLVTEKIYNFFTWVNPHQTLLYSAGFMVIYFYYRGIAILFLLIFFRYSSLVIASVIKAKPLQETAETKLQIYKRNLLFIQHGMELTVRTNEYYKKIFHDYDKTAIMQIFNVLKKFSLSLAVLLMIYNMNHLIILLYWSFLLYNTTYGGILFKIGFKKVEKIIDIVNNAIMSVFKTESPVNREVSPIKEQSIQTEHTTLSESLPNKFKPMVSNHKTFVTYENQRWWLGRGWCDQMLLGERPAWSDLQGNIDLPKENFTLPGFKWRWDGNWEVQVTGLTDQEGWEYATDFQKSFHPKAQAFDYVRRRRWMRRCVEEVIES